MAQPFDVFWSKYGLDVVEEFRLLRNNFYKCSQYRAAASLYRSGLGVIIPGKVLPYFSGLTIATDTPEEVAKQYFTLLINLAQALLNMPPRDMHRELAAMDASGVCDAAIAHLHWSLRQWHSLDFAEFVRQLQHTTCPPKLASLRDLLAKARSRKRIALERCGDISGALIDTASAVGKLPTCVTEEDLLEEILQGFGSRDSAVKIPKGATRIFSEHLECCHRAAVKGFDMPKVDVQLCPTPLGE
ncbi:g5722 [Coccomyxa elongata]